MCGPVGMFVDVCVSLFFCFFPAACQCHSHAIDCYYDAEVERRRASLNIHGRYDGGGVCINCQVGILKSLEGNKNVLAYQILFKIKRLTFNIMCAQHNTAGVNCEVCAEGHYRPHGVPRESPTGCIRTYHCIPH